MRPMKPGAARSALADNAAELLLASNEIPADLLDLVKRDAKLLAAVLGGAIEAALDALYEEDHGIARTPEQTKDIRARFWSHVNYACARLTRSLRASGQLDKIR